MALFHFTVTQTKRSKGQSAIASAAYRSGEKLYSEYYGEYSDYTRKRGVICSDILLPPHAPKEYADRQTLWNAVEKAERGKNAQLAYSFEISLQNEFCPYTTAQSTEQFNIFVKAEVSTNRLLRLFFFPGIFTRTANGTMLCLSAETEAAHRDMLMCEERRKVSGRTLPALINLIRSAMRETAVSSLSLKHP